jgi:hypothetical protein
VETPKLTLRVRVSIVPFGDEDKEREIHQINISNLGKDFEGGATTYGVEMGKYKSGEYDFVVKHWREDGALRLVERVLNEYKP